MWNAVESEWWTAQHDKIICSEERKAEREQEPPLVQIGENPSACDVLAEYQRWYEEMALRINYASPDSLTALVTMMSTKGL